MATTAHLRTTPGGLGGDRRDDSRLEALPWTWRPWLVPALITLVLVACAAAAIVATVVVASHPGPTGGGG
jgi:hypothetical protein